MSEDERAAAYRRQQVLGERTRRARERAMAGSPIARNRVVNAWAPIVEWLKERRDLH